MQVYDRKTFFEQFSGIEDAGYEAMAIFIEIAKPSLEKINKAIQTQDSNLLQYEAHSMKGSVGSFYAEIPRKLAEQLEISGRNNKFENLNSIFVELEKKVLELVQVFNDELKNR